ncbi:KH domain-containing, RNA-binding, signal transduction-associated protein 2-like [Corticium candelabrum]|uniref:KH domain-containing, RNA-binding, signal transduction-associated protein 2-like n=1 Tax=Corticium candelabrum TaxID=121492 RepID=UPI002E266254|nr:KH domain-containing, RNA-binding, signal transduction-associated protein 2-like [Corticium candelabrum]
MTAESDDDGGNYLKELTAEKEGLSPSYGHALRLLQQEIDRVQGRTTNGEETPSMVRLTEKVMIPVEDHPNFNFVGRLLGPRGLTLKRMQSETGCKMTILGRGSMRDKEQEDQLRACGDEKYTHLSEELHVVIEATGTKALAQARLAAGVAELRKMMIPGPFAEQLKNEQLRELAMINGTYREPPIRPPQFSPSYGIVRGIQPGNHPFPPVKMSPTSPLPRTPGTESMFQGFAEIGSYDAAPGSGNGYGAHMMHQYGRGSKEDWASDQPVNVAGRLKMPVTRLQQKQSYRDHPYFS